MEPNGAGAWRTIGKPEAALDRARGAYAAADGLYVIDLDGQFSGVANLPFFQALDRRGVYPWVDAGCRKPEDAMDVLFAGAESLTIQLRHMEPRKLAEVRELVEAELHVGFTVDERGLEQQLRPRDVLELAQRISATGIVLYEGERADLHSAENAAFELVRAGVPVTWVARPGSALTPHAEAGGRFSTLVVPEAAP